MVDTAEEMTEWVDAIRTAMIGSAGDFKTDESDVGEHSAVNENVLTGRETIDSQASTALTPPSAIHLWHKSEYPSNSNGKNFEGLPTYLSAEIRKFLFLQTAIANSRSSGEYRDLLDLYMSEPHFTVPVSFVKVLLFILSSDFIFIVSKSYTKKFTTTKQSTTEKEVYSH
jgi:hypothetical protein